MGRYLWWGIGNATTQTLHNFQDISNQFTSRKHKTLEPVHFELVYLARVYLIGIVKRTMTAIGGFLCY